ncbi:MAG TPA: ABC transporter permease, partial [Acidimicrobiales bacterium]|nr:ABC transporter permease [Acidimicrobiales bacterium]
MKALWIIAIAAFILLVRIGMWRSGIGWFGRRHKAAQAAKAAGGPAVTDAGGADGVAATAAAGGVGMTASVATQPGVARPALDGTQLAAREERSRLNSLEAALGDVGLVAGREVRERLRGRIFRVGTIIMLLAVGAAVVIPALNKNSSGGGATLQKVGVVGGLAPVTRELVLAAAQAAKDRVQFVPEASLIVARSQLKSGVSYFSIIDSSEVLLYEPATASASPADPGLVDTVAEYLGVVIAYNDAHLTPAQAETVTNSRSVPVRTLVAATKTTTRTPSIIGIVLLFFMLTQYCTWILIGVMQEKSSRVVEVLLAMVRPIQLLGGKVLGIGLVALGQALLIVGFAL